MTKKEIREVIENKAEKYIRGARYYWGEYMTAEKGSTHEEVMVNMTEETKAKVYACYELLQDLGIIDEDTASMKKTDAYRRIIEGKEVFDKYEIK